MNKPKNGTLELLKLFASYMVVFIHVIFPGKIGTLMETLARFAVPFFFLISGFYSYRIPPQKIKARVKSILYLIIFAAVSYTLFNIIVRLSSGGSEDISAYFVQYSDFHTLVKLFIFNVPICSEYMWYLYAILYVYVIFYFVTAFYVKDKVIFSISISILILHILSGEILSLFGIFLPGLLVRNFAVSGIPFFSIGLLVKKYQKKILTIPSYVILLSIIIGTLESIVSRYFFEKKEVYIGSLLISFAFVCLFIKYSNIKYPKSIRALEGCSTYVYIFHDMISKTLRSIYIAVGVNMKSSVLLENMHPIIVCICSTALAFLLVKVFHHKDCAGVFLR
ncbi:MAG: acyltransferase [Clostridia bacterium]|nr:acyltransferase [Clostridia bacterium]